MSEYLPTEAELREVQARGKKETRSAPADVATEAAVLGCCLSASDGLAVCEEWFGEAGALVFHDLRHRQIYFGMRELRRMGAAVDLITLNSWLSSTTGGVERAGGLAYVATLSDAGMPAALESYLEIVWTKYLGRLWLEQAASVAAGIYEVRGVNEVLLGRASELQSEFERKARQRNITPQFLKAPAAFAEEYEAQWFGHLAGEPGYELPIAFPLKLRRGETTLLSGDDKAGKSTFSSYVVLHLAAQLERGEKVFVASMETRPSVTLKLLASQLIGRKKLADTPEGRSRAGEALGWLQDHFLFYDFLGIADWREILDTMRYAAKSRGMVIGVIDSFMRIGIPDDDYAQQGLAAAQFAQFAKDANAHLLELIHENKSDGKGKAKVRGTKLMTANVDNITGIEINHAKGEKQAKLWWSLENERLQAAPDELSMRQDEAALRELSREWDTKLTLRGQRFPGSQQNGSKYFWFDPDSFQFRGKWEETAVDWLERWGRK